MIKAVVFDYGGVIEWKEGDLVGDISACLKSSREDWLRSYHSLNHLHNIEDVDWCEVACIASLKIGASDEQIDHIKHLITKSYETRKVDLGVVRVIQKLKRQNYKIGLLSNNSSKLRPQLKEDGTEELFDAIVISAEEGIQKPDPKIFQIIFNKLGVVGNETVFIDDSPRSLSRAEEIGYSPVLFIDDNQLKKDMEEILQNKTIFN